MLGRMHICAGRALDSHYCRPSCPAAPLATQRGFLHTGAEAEKQGSGRADLPPHEVPASRASERALRTCQGWGRGKHSIYGLAANWHNTWHITASISAGAGLRPRDLAAALRLARSRKCCAQEKELPTRSRNGYGSTSEFMKA